MFGVIVLALLLIMTIVGPLVYRQSPDAIDYSASLQPPSLQHPFGTDDLGRDLLARTMLGGRVSMAVGVVAVLIAITWAKRDHASSSNRNFGVDDEPSP